MCLSFPFYRFVADESGAVTVDWVVLGAAVVGLGLTSVTAVRSGVGSLGGDINTSLTGAAVTSGIFALDGFVFTEHSASRQESTYAAFAARTDADLVRYAAAQARNAARALAAGDYETAQFWTERRYISEMIMRDRGLTDDSGQPSANELRAEIDANAA